MENGMTKIEKVAITGLTVVTTASIIGLAFLCKILKGLDSE